MNRHSLAKTSKEPTPVEIAEKKRQELTEQALEAAPQVLQAVIKLACEGDLEAAELVFKVAGLDLSGSSSKSVQNAIQINITQKEQEMLEADFQQGRIGNYSRQYDDE
ncbi:hypothetical protein D2962_09740 [Biomaibacter acetigenes]|uniref:Uncharacterized protein n=1 Tax=Biomaibacter acetigenes TaxID=2316383 RepID=A0A3G2R632_9FIRM|nr:hypothetical protein [Biomaibacter acetigenes]AYO30861.1 hypothetical protein D2962_09740 [Biomaibacter acetigenes]RKL62321.1 hypothetical protein DXT63_11870 [Thermoanaerobacteraceae bacterium SP2]